jgi:EAL domain-containing protein (putative c-di-GMP-specific phosphodiesterase class I)/GGDEF domain-containing protein
MNFFNAILLHFTIASSVAGATWISNFYSFPNREESVVVLGSGVILGLLYRLGSKAIPALFVGVTAYFIFVRSVSIPVSLWVAFSMLLSNWLGLFYLRRTLSKELIDQPVKNFLHFYVAALFIIPLCSAVLLLPIIWWTELVDVTRDMRIFFFSISFGQALGALVLAPAIMLYGQQFSQKYIYADYSGVADEKLWWLITVAAMVVITLMLGEKYFLAGILDAELLLYPMMIWSALRLGVIFTNIAVAVVSMIVFTFHFFGIAGSMGDMNILQVLGMLLLIITLAVMGQLVAATTLERRRQAALLQAAAYQDPITKAANLCLLKQQIQKINQKENKILLGYISICNHGALIQGYGLEARNELYCQFNGFLQLEITSALTVYRVSGPAFAVLFEHHDVDQAAAIMHNLAERVKTFRFVWQGQSLHINIVLSLVPVFDENGALQDPLEHASALADNAYTQGNIGILVVSNIDHNIAKRKVRADWLGRLNKALAEDYFTLFAQPIVPVDSSVNVHSPRYFEILLRLLEPHGDSMAMPDDFIPHAESFHLMPNIDRWVVRQVLKWLSSSAVDLEQIGLCSINLSGQSVADPMFSSEIEQLFQEYAVPAAKICFEITETIAVANLHSASSFVFQMQDLGCKVALDDFGSGLAPFEYLKRLPVNILKIDGAFIKSLPDSEIDYIIVDAVVRVAKVKKLQTVAEYAESEEILSLLAELGVHFAQGFCTGKPVSLERFLIEQEVNPLSR